MKLFIAICLLVNVSCYSSSGDFNHCIKICEEHGGIEAVNCSTDMCHCVENSIRVYVGSYRSS